MGIFNGFCCIKINFFPIYLKFIPHIAMYLLLPEVNHYPFESRVGWLKLVTEQFILILTLLDFLGD